MTMPGGAGDMSTSFNQDLRRQIFGEQPELAFLGHLSRAGLNQQDEQFLRGRAGDFLQRLQQAMGRELVQGGLPTLQPDQFFEGLDFRNELSRFSPEQRGRSMSQFAPRTRFQF